MNIPYEQTPVISFVVKAFYREGVQFTYRNSYDAFAFASMCHSLCFNMKR